MDCALTDNHNANSVIQHGRKRKRKQKGVDSLSRKRHNGSDNIGIDRLPDDILIAILSRLSLKDAVRTSVLSRRWRHIWMFTSGTLKFDARDIATRTKSTRSIKFESMVNCVLDLHQGRCIDSLIIRLVHLSNWARFSEIERWIYLAMQKEVKGFELNISVRYDFPRHYKFPKIKNLLSRSHEVMPAFSSLRFLRLVGVNIKDGAVRYFLASCPNLEQLCIRSSNYTKNLEVVDPLPNLKVLEIRDCVKIQSLEISATNLVSFIYQGKQISLSLKKTPNLSELTLGGDFCWSFFYEPNKHSSYSVQLEKLVLNLKPLIRRERTFVPPPDLPLLYSLKRLELKIMLPCYQSLLFFISLIKESPLLNELKIKINHLMRRPVNSRYSVQTKMPFPQVKSLDLGRFRQKNLKVVQMSGYYGLPCEDTFLLQLFKIAPSLEMVSINTNTRFYRFYGNRFLGYYTRIDRMPFGKSRRDTTRMEMTAKRRARILKSLLERGAEWRE